MSRHISVQAALGALSFPPDSCMALRIAALRSLRGQRPLARFGLVMRIIACSLAPDAAHECFVEQADDERAHRSGQAASECAAMQLEDEDEHTRFNEQRDEVTAHELGQHAEDADGQDDTVEQRCHVDVGQKGVHS